MPGLRPGAYPEDMHEDSGFASARIDRRTLISVVVWVLVGWTVLGGLTFAFFVGLEDGLGTGATTSLGFTAATIGVPLVGWLVLLVVSIVRGKSTGSATGAAGTWVGNVYLKRAGADGNQHQRSD